MSTKLCIRGFNYYPKFSKFDISGRLKPKETDFVGFIAKTHIYRDM